MATITLSIAGDGKLSANPKKAHVHAGEEVSWLSPEQVQVTFNEPGRWTEGGTASGPMGARAHVKPDTLPGMLGCHIEMGGKSLDAGVIVDPR